MTYISYQHYQQLSLLMFIVDKLFLEDVEKNVDLFVESCG